jgi:hypothetical protein
LQTAPRRHQEPQVNQLAKQASELALRLAALPADGSRYTVQALDDMEQLADRVLKNVAELRARPRRAIGETSGIWRAMQPVKRR